MDEVAQFEFDPGGPLDDVDRGAVLDFEFDWDPDSPPETLFFAVGVSVVWESDATHYLGDITVTID